MHLGFTVVVILFACSCVLVACSDEHLVPKHGIESKRDFSVADAEFILKKMLAKLGYNEDAELVHKKIYNDKEHYMDGSESMSKAHLASMKEDDKKYLGKSEPLGHEYMEEKLIPLEKDGYGIKKDFSLTEKDIMALLMKMKEFPASKGTEDVFKKESYYGTPEGKLLSEKTYLSEDSALKTTTGKMFEDESQFDKFNDKDVSLAESLYHMKIAGDVETYPELKMASLIEMHNKKKADEMLLGDEGSLHKVNSEESFMKKIDDISKSLLKEETYPVIKDDNIKEYLKKVEAEEKDQLEKSFTLDKSTDKKALDSWKANHKDIFSVEEGHLLDEKVKLGGTNFEEEGFSHGIPDELLKKLKTSLGMDKESGTEHDELLHLIKGLNKKEEDISEGTIGYEKARDQVHKDVHAHLDDEEMKKHIDGSLSFGAKDIHGTELFSNKDLAGEKAHGTDIKIGFGEGKSFGEEAIKSKDTYGLGEAFDFEKEKTLYGSKSGFGNEGKHSITHGIPVESDKSFKFDDEILKKDKDFGTDGLFPENKKIFETSGDHHMHDVVKDEAHIPHDSTIDKHHASGTGTEKIHKTFQDLKSKFFELLTTVLRTRKCHLVSMRPSELLGIVNCISKSKDPVLCEKFTICEKKMPVRARTALEKCQRQTIPGEMKRCTRYAPLYPSAEIPLKIFKCMALTVGELAPEEKQYMINFEECARVLKAESCRRFKWFQGPH